MSHPANDNYYEQQKEIEEEQRYPMTPNELTDEKRKQFTIEQDLMLVGTTLARLLSKRVDRRIISDTIINSAEYRDLTEICSNIDSHLRSVKF